jgi:hypothetical protein
MMAESRWQWQWDLAGNKNTLDTEVRTADGQGTYLLLFLVNPIQGSYLGMRFRREAMNIES